MPNVSFNEEPEYARPSRNAQKPVLTRLILATKFVATDKQAEYVLIGIAVLALVVTLWLWPFGRSAPAENIPVAGPPSLVR